jgi:hypothetical protein
MATKYDNLLGSKVAEEYGEEFLDVVNTVARTAGQAAYTQAKQDIHTTQRNAMVEILNAKVPNWRQVNTADAFCDWLETKLPNGKTLKEVLQAAWNSNIASEVADIFIQFMSSPEAQNMPQPRERQERQRDEGGRFAQGGRRPEQRVTPQDMKDFYRRKQVEQTRSPGGYLQPNRAEWYDSEERRLLAALTGRG